jgi:hypothetical protein
VITANGFKFYHSPHKLRKRATLVPGMYGCFVHRTSKEQKTTLAAIHSLHKLRKRRNISPKGRESPPLKGKKKLVGIWRVAGSPLLQLASNSTDIPFPFLLNHLLGKQ